LCKNVNDERVAKSKQIYKLQYTQLSSGQNTNIYIPAGM